MHLRVKMSGGKCPTIIEAIIMLKYQYRRCKNTTVPRTCRERERERERENNTAIGDQRSVRIYEQFYIVWIRTWRWNILNCDSSIMAV